MSDEPITTPTVCKARETPEVTAEWEEWQLLVPGLMTGGTMEAPEFEDDWVPVTKATVIEDHVNFSLAYSPGGWISFPLDHEVKVREGW